MVQVGGWVFFGGIFLFVLFVFVFIWFYIKTPEVRGHIQLFVSNPPSAEDQSD